MADLSITSFDQLSSDAIADNEDLLIQILREYSDQLDLKDGTALRQLVVYTNAILDTMNKDEVERLRQSQSLLEIEENPDLADPEIVDAILSNFLVVRRAATTVSGPMTIVQATNTSLAVPDSTVFTLPGGRTFVPTQSFIGVTDANLVTADNERLIQRSTQLGGWYFIIDVVETTSGGAFVPAGTNFEVDTVIAGVSRAFNSEDFPAALEEETNQELIDRLAEGMSVRAASDRVSTSGIIRDQYDIVRDISIMGQGDVEMRRDKHNIVGMAPGGKADIYVRSAVEPPITKVTVRGVAQASGNTGIVYRLTLDPAVAPAGFYRVEEVRHAVPGSTYADTAAFSLIFEEVGDRAIRVLDAPFSPYIGDFGEAVYSKYQGAVQVEVTDPLTDSSYDQAFGDELGTETSLVRYYDVFISAMPSIEAIQDFLNTRDRRQPGGDYLVRAGIPVFVSAELVVEYVVDAGEPDSAAVAVAVSNAINATTFAESKLQASVLINAAYSTLTENQRVVLPIVMRGDLRLPSGDIRRLSSSSALEVPTIVDEGVSSRNTLFLSYPSSIVITLRPVTNLEA